MIGFIFLLIHNETSLVKKEYQHVIPKYIRMGKLQKYEFSSIFVAKQISISKEHAANIIILCSRFTLNKFENELFNRFNALNCCLAIT